MHRGSCSFFFQIDSINILFSNFVNSYTYLHLHNIYCAVALAKLQIKNKQIQLFNESTERQ